MSWHLRDIIDLEYLLHQDATTSLTGERDSLHERDRTIFLDTVKQPVDSAPLPDRQGLIKAWLNRRRETARNETMALPGEHAESLFGLLRSLFPAAGLISGAAAAASLLTYTGDRPVNVFAYLALFVASQLLLLLLFGVSLPRLATKSFPASSSLYGLIARSMLKVLLSARNRVSERLSADQRLRSHALLGTITGKARAYGALCILPLVLLTQLFAASFNVGLLAATLFKVTTADIAFGWQSTIQLSPSAVHTLAQSIALPWSWAIAGDTAFPTLAQIEGSRIVLKEGIYHLATPDLVSWWPFLCLAVLVYGLLPRLLLLAGTALALRKRLDALEFRQGSHEELLLRMTTPLVSTRGQAVEGREPATALSAPPTQAGEQAAEPLAIAARDLLVLIPDELYHLTSPAEIAAVARSGGAFTVREILRTGQDFASDRQILTNLSERILSADTDILLIKEAWQPPIMEDIDYIRELRTAAGKDVCIRIGLIGKPLPETIFTPAADEHRQIWTGKITAIGDPCIFCQGLTDYAT